MTERASSVAAAAPERKEEERVHGLGNLGNTCFLNALLQSLASFLTLREDLLSSAATATPAAPCAIALQAALARVRTTGDPSAPSEQNDEVHKWGWHWWGGGRATAAANRRLWLAMQQSRLIRAGEQEDAEELLGKLCEHLSDELTAVGVLAAAPSRGLRMLLRNPTAGVDIASGLEPRPAAWCHPERWPWTVHYQHGLQRLQGLQARGHQFWALQLPLSMTGSRGSCKMGYRLEDCIASYLNAEVVDGVYCELCSANAAISTTAQAMRPRTRAVAAATAAAVPTSVDALDDHDITETSRKQMALRQWVAEMRLAASGDPVAEIPWGSKSKKLRPPRVGRQVRRWTSIRRRPHCLVLQLQRNQIDYRTGYMVKNPTPIRFPLVLDFDRAISCGVEGAVRVETGIHTTVPTTTETARVCTYCTGKLSEGGSLGGRGKCTRCKAAWYCSKSCQRNDWPTHKLICKVNAAAAEVESLRCGIIGTTASKVKAESVESKSVTAMENSDFSSSTKHRRPQQLSASSSQLQVYDLVSVVLHHGTALGGHYTSLVRVGNNAWAHCDDEQIHREVSEATVLNEQSSAYMLFYEQRI